LHKSDSRSKNRQAQVWNLITHLPAPSLKFGLNPFETAETWGKHETLRDSLRVVKSGTPVHL
jgi:hypothetical protein